MHIYHKTRLTALLVFTQLFALTAVAGTEAQMAKTAEKYFVAKQFTQAAPLYAQLVSSNPKSYKYNYYYGICLLITGKDKNEAIPYLETAMNSPKTPEDIYYYMGRACHLTYNFEQAIRSFTEFNTIIGSKSAPRWQTPRMIAMVNNAMQILDTTKFSEITESTETGAGDFYSHYAFANPNGKLLSMPDEVIKTSKSQEEVRPMIFLSANNRVMYYSAVSPETSSRDIYRVEKDLDNNWGEPTRIANVVNSTQDELYPTCNADGRILYFSSRGHNSTGGFDVFKCYYNTVTKTFSVPENMGSPVNSPDDDFCFVASSEENSAYFTSQRASGPGTFTVYKMKYSSKEELPVAINGRFSCIGQPDLKTATLIISKAGSEVANIQTDTSNGTYAMELPGPGTYQFRVEVPGFNPIVQEITFGEFSDNIFVQDIILSRDYKGLENLAITSRRLSEAEKLDNSLMAAANEDENGTSGGVTSHDLANSNGGLVITSMDVPGDNANGSGNADGTVNRTNRSGNMISTSDDQVKVPAMPGIHFKVQIGAFRKYGVNSVEGKLAKRVDKTQMTHSQDPTWLRFYFGDEVTYKSAKNLRLTLVGAGFSDAFVVAFNGDKSMKLYDAIKLTTNNK